MQLLRKGEFVVSHKNTSRKTYYLAGGIKARMTQRTEASRLVLSIPKMVARKNKTIKRKSPYLIIDFQSKKDITEDVLVKIRIPYKYDSMGIIKEEAIKLEVNDENFFGTVIVYPRFYLSQATREINEKKQDQVYLAILHDTRKYKPSASKYDLYTHTNITHPYRG